MSGIEPGFICVDSRIVGALRRLAESSKYEKDEATKRFRFIVFQERA